MLDAQQLATYQRQAHRERAEAFAALFRKIKGYMSFQRFSVTPKSTARKACA